MAHLGEWLCAKVEDGFKSEERVVRDVKGQEIAWDSPFHPDNPRNWTTLKKTLHTLPPAFLALSVTAGSSMITPGVFQIEEKFGVSQTAAILSLSLFVLGLALGPLIAAPISETRGRAIVYKISIPVYILFILGAGLSNTFGGLLACRFFAAMAGAPCLAVAAGTVADLFEPVKMVPLGSIVVMAPFLGPCFGPVIGGFVASYKSYRWTQYCTIFLALTAYLTVLPTQETYLKVILKKRAKKLDLPPPEPELPPREALKLLFTIVIFRPLHMLVSEPIVLFYSLYNAFTFSVLFAFFEAYPYVFINVYGFNLWQYGLTFLAIGGGVLLGVVGAVLIDIFVYQKDLPRDKEGNARPKPPEERLYIGMIGALCLPVGLIWFAMTAEPGIHWIAPVLAGVPFAFGNVTVFISAALYMLDCYGPLSGASAMAANGILRYICGAAFPLFTVQMYEKMTTKWATAFLGLVCVFMLPIPLVFYRFGPTIRKNSRYSTYEAL